MDTKRDPLYVHELCDRDGPGTQIIEPSPDTAGAAGSPRSRETFEGQLTETQRHLAKVYLLLKNLDASSRRTTNHAPARRHSELP